MKKFLVVVAALLALLPDRNAAGAPGKILYSNDFEKAAPDQPPADFLVLDGEFTVKAEGGNRFLELPGAPLDTFGVLFGQAADSGVTVGARIFGTAKGRRSPSFGVGANGAGGYKLMAAPGKNALELHKGDDVVATAPLTWKSGAWTQVRLHVRPQAGGAWIIEGKAWTAGDPEPDAWAVHYEEKTAPHAGRPSVWGSPYSGTPIRFDDLTVTADP